MLTVRRQDTGFAEGSGMAWDSVVVEASNALTMRWAREHCNGSGTVIAGTAVWPLLAVLAAGAQAEARTELEAATGIPASDGMAGATSALSLLNSSPAIRSALGTWVHAVSYTHLTLPTKA